MVMSSISFYLLILKFQILLLTPSITYNHSWWHKISLRFASNSSCWSVIIISRMRLSTMILFSFFEVIMINVRWWLTYWKISIILLSAIFYAKNNANIALFYKFQNDLNALFCKFQNFSISYFIVTKTITTSLQLREIDNWQCKSESFIGCSKVVSNSLNAKTFVGLLFIHTEQSTSKTTNKTPQKRRTDYLKNTDYLV